MSREGSREMLREVPRDGERGKSDRGRGERQERQREAKREMVYNASFQSRVAKYLQICMICLQKGITLGGRSSGSA